MREATGDLFSYIGRAHGLCLTTNGDVNGRGLAVMGRGVALQAARRWPPIREALAGALRANGNGVNYLGVVAGTRIYSFPVKHHWHERADVVLIRRSAEQLAARDWTTDASGTACPLGTVLFVLPRPGCGNGGLDWAEVRSVLADVLDDRFLVAERG